MNKPRAILALEDGTVFHGEAFGASATATGEVCFNTSMTGYQEILTDPSYKAQIVTMTCPQIGNYGVNTQDVESWRSHVSGFVVRELSPVVSNWRAEMSLDEYLKRNEVPGIQGIDTRALTKKLRVGGAMKGVISTERLSDVDAVEMAREWEGLIGIDYVRHVTHGKVFDWDREDTQSYPFRLIRGVDDIAPTKEDDTLPPADIRIVAYDFGIKYNILRKLRQAGFDVCVVPADMPADKALEMGPRGIFLSNGPGDPAAVEYAVRIVEDLLKTGLPIFGICLGHQIMARAFGADTFKLKFGHRGANQPVKDLRTNRVEITAQNHGFAVVPETLPESVFVDRINLNDNTVEGLRHRNKPFFSVQYHPEASPGPHDSGLLFSEFRRMIESKDGEN
ncbi:MAG: glutamine-hydrolyzing carbamoyl-phosphate synthase small subunit [Verrucomicrobia bacterium]|nr:glutamine-hydrolyzing carbamoyl-phosphate synthase small subunit [Verrucomicrobiota bacterium]